jgi:hypothetical protein
MEDTRTTDTDIIAHATIMAAIPIMGTGIIGRAIITGTGITARVTRMDTTAHVSTMAAIGTTGIDTTALAITDAATTVHGGTPGLATATASAGEVRSTP